MSASALTQNIIHVVEIPGQARNDGGSERGVTKDRLSGFGRTPKISYSPSQTLESPMLELAR